MRNKTKHVSVLLSEAVDGLAITPESVVVDCTLGAGGHAQEILNRLSKDGMLVGFDADPLVIEQLESTLVGEAATSLQCRNFRTVKDGVKESGVTYVNAILADLGWRTEQFIGAESGKGFSFQSDEPLIMTFGSAEDYVFTAHDVVNDWDESSLADIIFGYGEERQARRIAKMIVAAREEGEIVTAKQLADVVSAAVPKRFQLKHIHPATKTFQAIRIAVNDELSALEQLINDGFDLLHPDGRMAIISFHSLEDRVVKLLFRKLAQDDKAELITKKPLTPSAEERAQNTRSRSAKLRIIKKV